MKKTIIIPGSQSHVEIPKIGDEFLFFDGKDSRKYRVVGIDGPDEQLDLLPIHIHLNSKSKDAEHDCRISMDSFEKAMTSGTLQPKTKQIKERPE